MVNQCANPKCAKPLHYLREGRIFVFNLQTPVMDSSAKLADHLLRHYWLCGDCSQHMFLEKTTTGVRLVNKPNPLSSERIVEALAS